MADTPAKRPNFVLIVVDDMGFSDVQPFGGEIRTPVVQQLAEQGVRFRNFHVSSLCAPTRAMLLSGVDNHQNGLGVMPPFHSTNQYLQPGYEGPLNHRVTTIAELLSSEGYDTYRPAWHLGASDGHPGSAGPAASSGLILSPAGLAISTKPARRSSRSAAQR